MTTSNASTYNYKFSTKNQWRKQMWNDIERRLLRPPSEALVLYLPGPENIDEKELLQRGFKKQNLVGIERDKNTCMALRKRGVNCICADATKVIDAWPHDKFPDVIFMDFAGPITMRVYDWIKLHSPGRDSTIWAFNVLCGRESHSPVINHWEEVGVGSVTHRFKRMFAMRYADVAGMCKTRKLDNMILASGTPIFRTYVSTSGQRFDSVVYGGDSVFCGGLSERVFVPGMEDAALGAVASTLKLRKDIESVDAGEVQKLLKQNIAQLESTKRRISAALAVMTIRCGGKRGRVKEPVFKKSLRLLEESLHAYDDLDEDKSVKEINNIVKKAKEIHREHDLISNKHERMVAEWVDNNDDVVACIMACWDNQKIA